MSSDSPIEAVKHLQRTVDHSFVWVGFSGGRDSSVLLHAVVKVFGAELCGAIHIDHQISDFSASWSSHCQLMCRDLGIRFLCRSVKLKKGNVEKQARSSRYEEWTKVLSENEIIVTAHHQDDLAETRLWQLLTGRAPIGIPYSRPLGLGQVVRPFLVLKRDDLKSYAQENALEWVEDESNRDLSYDRNWLRHHLLPILQTRFPRSNENLAKLDWPELPHLEREALPINSVSSEISVRSWLRPYGVFPRNVQIQEIQRQNCVGKGLISVSLSKVLSVRSYRQNLYVVFEKEPIQNQYVRVGDFLNLESGRLYWRRSKYGFRKGDLVFLRTRNGGEKITLNSAGKLLSKIFYENQILPWQRDGWPLLFVNGSLEAIPGIAMSDKQLSNEYSTTFTPVWEPVE